MHQYSRISFVVGLVLLVLLLSFLVSFPSRTIDLHLLGESWQIVVSGSWFLGVLLAAVVYLGNDSIVRSHPAAYTASLSYTLTFWPLPGLLVLAAVPFLYTFRNPLLWLVGAPGLALLLAAILAAQYQVIDIHSPLYRPSRWFLDFFAYGLGFALYLSLRQLHAPVVLLWLMTGLISALLALEILRQSLTQMRRTWGHALLVALLMSQMAWILSYWPFANLLNALYLFWPFYLLTSVMHQYLGGQLNRAVALEFATLGVIGWGILWYYTP